QDPFNDENRIGGYCTLLAGKFTGAGGRVGFDAQARLSERRLGELPCSGGPGGGPPCGTERTQGYAPPTPFNINELFQFMDASCYPVPGATGTFTNQPFLIWYAPRIPHAPLRAPQPVRTYLFGNNGLGGLFALGAMCRGSVCPGAVAGFNDSNIGTEREFYDSVWWV